MITTLTFLVISLCHLHSKNNYRLFLTLYMYLSQNFPAPYFSSSLAETLMSRERASAVRFFCFLSFTCDFSFLLLPERRSLSFLFWRSFDKDPGDIPSPLI